MDQLPDLAGARPLKGRGAVSNPTGRFEREVRVRADDGWGAAALDNVGSGAARDNMECATARDNGRTGLLDPTDTAAADAARPRTQVMRDATRAVLTRNKSPDVPFDRSVNPYRGCEHGCIYCFARPTHAYLGLSPGLDFETRILAKPEAPKLLARELSRRNYVCRPIAMGTNTDPYQPTERKMRITRGILKVLSAFNHPVSIVTKSDAVLADLDLLASLAKRRLAKVYLSISTLRRRSRPQAGAARGVAREAPRRRRRAPGSRRAGRRDGGADHPGADRPGDGNGPRPGKGRRRRGSRLHPPAPAARSEGAVRRMAAGALPRPRAQSAVAGRDTRGGQLNDPNFGSRMRGQGPYAALIAARFNVAIRRLGLGRERAHAQAHDQSSLDCSKFAPPARKGDQLRLF